MILSLDSVGSTQHELSERLKVGDIQYRGILAKEQTSGVGRRDRKWFSPRGSCFAFSFWTPLGDLAPHLVGMWAAISAAESLDCSLQWPNDLVINNRKLGGVLATTVTTPAKEKIAVIGIGVNLNVKEFPPDISFRATSLVLEGREPMEAEELANRILEETERLPRPTSFAQIREKWFARDTTTGKVYRLMSGEPATAIADVNGQLLVVSSAEAWYV
jgi:BirA family biotin operon repressor/biotin-[acetyl-CoA-carboxylase] ligase